LRSFNYASEIVDCFDDLSGAGGLQRAPPFKMKEHIQIVCGTGKAVKKKISQPLWKRVMTRLFCAITSGKSVIDALGRRKMPTPGPTASAQHA